MIDRFVGEYAFLSNFFEIPIYYSGILYQNSEAAFQAQKTLDPEERKKFSTLNPSEAKKKGRHVTLRDDWEQVKDDIMFDIVLSKFASNPVLKNLLLDTNNEELIEGNTWNDTYWGVCNGKGQNHLGKILMKVRSLLNEAYPDF